MNCAHTMAMMNMNHCAPHSPEAYFSCAFSSDSCADANCMIVILDTIFMVSIFVMLVIGLLCVLRLLGILAVIGICLITVASSPTISAKEQRSFA